MFHWPSVMFYVSQKLIEASRIETSEFLVCCQILNFQIFNVVLVRWCIHCVFYLQIVYHLYKRERKKEMPSNKNSGS